MCAMSFFFSSIRSEIRNSTFSSAVHAAHALRRYDTLTKSSRMFFCRASARSESDLWRSINSCENSDLRDKMSVWSSADADERFVTFSASYSTLCPKSSKVGGISWRLRSSPKTTKESGIFGGAFGIAEKFGGRGKSATTFLLDFETFDGFIAT